MFFLMAQKHVSIRYRTWKLGFWSRKIDQNALHGCNVRWRKDLIHNDFVRLKKHSLNRLNMFLINVWCSGNTPWEWGGVAASRAWNFDCDIVTTCLELLSTSSIHCHSFCVIIFTVARYIPPKIIFVKKRTGFRIFRHSAEKCPKMSFWIQETKKLCYF